WDLGAGSGSVGISAAQRVSSLRIFLVDQDPIQVRLAQLNSEKLSTAMVIAGRSEDVMWQLPDPNAVFVGGGGLEVLNTLKKRLTAPTFVLASFAAIDRAVTAANLLGRLMQVMLPVGKLLPNGSWRFEAENPVFLTWGWLG
ncbi:MAG: methyltransferase, partial [Actinomycetota bacterium]|nr:methyltransferase [Actinomycetota bacterium]